MLDKTSTCLLPCAFAFSTHCGRDCPSNGVITQFDWHCLHDCNGDTPLDAAVRGCCYEAAELLVDLVEELPLKVRSAKW